MLHFTANPETNLEPITPGSYEVELTAEWKKTREDVPYINCCFKIREDVEQEFKGRLVFDGIYKSKKTGELQASKINGILSTIPNVKQDFESYDELLQYINGTKMIITIDIEEADPSIENSKDRNILVYMSYKPTQHPVKLEEITDDDLPF